MSICGYCHEDTLSHMCPKFVEKIRAERDAANLQIRDLKAAVWLALTDLEAAQLIGVVSKRVENATKALKDLFPEVRVCPKCGFWNCEESCVAVKQSDEPQKFKTAHDEGQTP